MMQKLRFKQSSLATLRQTSSRLNRSNNSYQSLPHKSVRNPPSKSKIFELPSNKQNQSIVISQFCANQNYRESLKASLVELDDMKRSYSNVCEERKKYIDIIDWLKHTLSEVNEKADSSTYAGDLRNIFSTAVGQIIKESRVENNQKSRLLKLSWEALMNISCREVKTLEDRLANIYNQISHKHKLERQQYDRQIKQYRDRILDNAADLAQKQRFFYEVVTDNRIMRNRLKKVMNRLKHELESNSYLKEENMMFYKQNQKMKMVLDSEDLDSKYKVLHQKFDALEKQFQMQKKKITKVNIIKELDEDQMRQKLGIKEEVDQIVRRVDVDDLLDLEIVETPNVQELARLYYTAGVQTEAVTHDRSTNTPSVFLGKKGVAIQCGGFQRSKYFSYYRCEDIMREATNINLGVDLLAAYRQKNLQLKGDIRMREQMDKNRGLTSQDRSFKKLVVPPTVPGRQLQRARSRKRTVSPSRFIQAASEYINKLNDQNKDQIKSRTEISQASRLSQVEKIDSDKQDSLIKRSAAMRRSNHRVTNVLVPVRSSMKKNSVLFNQSPRKSKLSRIFKIENGLIQDSQKFNQNQQPSLPESEIKTVEARSDTGQFLEEYPAQRLTANNSVSETIKEHSLRYRQRNSQFEDQFLIDVYSPDEIKNSSINSSMISKTNKDMRKTFQVSNDDKPKPLMRKNSHRKSMTAESFPTQNQEGGRRNYKDGRNQFLVRKDKQQKQEILATQPIKEKQPLKIQKNEKNQKSLVENQNRAKVELPTIVSKVSEISVAKTPIQNINKIQERESESEISSNLSFCNVIQSKKIQIPEQRRYSRFSSLNIDKNLYQSHLEELNNFEMSLIKNQIDSSQQLPLGTQVNQTLLKRTMNTTLKQMFKHRQNIIAHCITFQQFIDSIIHRAYGVSTISFDVKSKVKSSLLTYDGDNKQKLSFKYLLEGKNDESDYKRYFFVLYTLCCEFQTLYRTADNALELLSDFVKDLLSKFCSINVVKNFIKNNINTKNLTDKNELFHLLKLFIDNEASHQPFTQTLHKLRLCHNNKNTIYLRDFYDIMQIVQPNTQFIILKLREISPYCNKKSGKIPVFKLILLLKKLGWNNCLNLEQMLKMKFFERFGVSNGNITQIEQNIAELKIVMPRNKYLSVLAPLSGQEIKQNYLLMYYLVKLQYSSRIINQFNEKIMGSELISISSLFNQLAAQSIFGK